MSGATVKKWKQWYVVTLKAFILDAYSGLSVETDISYS